MSNNYKELENQIGGLGAEEAFREAESLKGKRLKNAASYGGREELDAKDEAAMESFLSRSRAVREEPINIGEGWIPLNREEMGIRSFFYNENWEFYIKPATVNMIKNWTAVDEDRPDLLHKLFNEICRTCIKVETKDINGSGWGQINSWDRFWFILKVREYTFSSNTSKIEFEDECSECGENIIYNLTSDSLYYEFPDEDIIEKYWNGREWQIDPKEYDVEHEPITLYTPKLAKDDAIIEWATNRARNKQKIDETFLKFLVWMLPRVPKDPQMLDRQIQKIYNEYKSWDIDMFEFMDDVINNITINPSEKLRCKCVNCGGEATSNVQFPNGIKVLFKTESKAKKFGSK